MADLKIKFPILMKHLTQQFASEKRSIYDENIILQSYEIKTSYLKVVWAGFPRTWICLGTKNMGNLFSTNIYFHGWQADRDQATFGAQTNFNPMKASSSARVKTAKGGLQTLHFWTMSTTVPD